MSLLDEFFNEKSQIKYTPPKNILSSTLSLTGKAIKSTNNFTKNSIKMIYYNSIDWCKCMEGTEIHKVCAEHILNQLPSCIDMSYAELKETINVNDIAKTYWYGNKVQKKYTKHQLKRIEKEMDMGKTSEDLCNEMLIYTWLKIKPNKTDDEMFTENDMFKIRNKFKR